MQLRYIGERDSVAPDQRRTRTEHNRSALALKADGRGGCAGWSRARQQRKSCNPTEGFQVGRVLGGVRFAQSFVRANDRLIDELLRLRIRHLLADGTRRALAYGWQPQSEVFHTADYILEPFTQFTLCKYGGTTLARYSRRQLFASAAISASSRREKRGRPVARTAPLSPPATYSVLSKRRGHRWQAWQSP